MSTESDEKSADLEELLRLIDETKKQLTKVTEHDHSRIFRIRLIKAVTWLTHVRSVAHDSIDHHKRFGEEKPHGDAG